MSRAPWGTGSLTYASFKYEGDSVWAVFWNCPKPYILEVYRISLDTSTAKLWDSSDVIRIIVYLNRLPKTTMSFFYQPSSFRRELPLWYSVSSTLVSPTTGLTWTLYNLFGSHYSVIFILNPIPVILSKIFFWVSLATDSILLEER